MPYYPPRIGQTASQVADAVATGIASKTTSNRLFTQMQVQPGDTITASTTNEQTYATSFTIPADSLVMGQALIIKGSGVYSTSALLPPSQRARLRMSGLTLIDSGQQNVLVSLVASRYTFDMQLMVRAVGVNGLIEAYGTLTFATSLSTAVTVLGGPSGTFGEAGNPVAIDTTKDMPLTLSCQFSAAQANNSNSLRQLSVHTLKPVA